MGLPSWLAIHSYGRQPITVDTWPGPMKASRRMSGESRIARMAGMMVTWFENTEKLRMPLGASAHQRESGGRRGGFEADGEEHHVAVGIVLRQSQRVGGRVDNADVSAAGLVLKRTAAACPARASCRRTR